MLREAGDFAGHLKRCEKDIRNLKNATEGVLVFTARHRQPGRQLLLPARALPLLLSYSGQLGLKQTGDSQSRQKTACAAALQDS